MMVKTTRFLAGAILLAATFAAAASAQSTDQAFPTPVTANIIEASISARDIGDSRLTTYYYTFDSGQGDLFINIVSNNLTGDIDLFTLNTMLQLTTVSVYGDLSESETGRVVYFRKPEKLLLRIQGRTPNDETATVTIKFAGGFIAAAGGNTDERPELPTVTAENTSGVVVNSVGTVIERRTKPEPEKEIARAEQEDDKSKPESPVAEVRQEVAEAVGKKPEVVVTDNIEPEKKVEPKAEEPKETRRTSRRRTEKTPEKKETAEEKKEHEVKDTAQAEKPEPAEEPKAEPIEKEKPAAESSAKSLSNIKLVVLFKNGTKIERPMDQVLRFSVDNGVLTIISMDGRIGRYSIFDIERTTIE